MGANASSLSESHSSRDRLFSSSSCDSSESQLACLEPWLLGGVTERGRELGRGSFAVAAELEVRGKKLAGKRLQQAVFEAASQAKRDEMLSRFAGECALLQSLRHPNIVRFLGIHFSPDSPVPWLVMELMDTTLAARLVASGVPEPPLCYNILSDVALGVRHLHGLSPPIVHRDLTANNVLLTSSLQAKISDLGVAKVLDFTAAERARVTQTARPGTLCYMPPEALVDRPHYDTSIDVFSFGILMLHTLCGDWPHPIAPTMIDPDDPERILPVSEFERRIQFVARIREGLEHPALPLLRKCIHNSPDCRPSIDSVTRAITELQAKVAPGKVYHPRQSYDPASHSEVSLSVGDEVQVFGSGRRQLKCYCLTSGEAGYVPANILRDLEHTPRATALYSSPAETSEGLTICEGDSLHILSVDNEEWWYAINDSTGKAGFVPCNYVKENLPSYRWYLDSGSHADADSLLKQERNTTGSFLVHKESPDLRCLSVRGKDCIMHYKIQESKGELFIVEQTKFKSLQDLVYFYSSQHGGVLCASLKHPYHVPRGDDEVPRNSVRLTHKIGKGKFGEIWHGTKGTTHVAVKVLATGSPNKAEFLREATTLTQLNHPKIIRCEGICSEQEPIYVLMEFLKFGNLVEYLQKGEGKGIHFLDLVSLGLQVAMGMAYLEGQGYIHCDLAARSVAVGDGKLCKIQNFERARRAASYKLPPRFSVPVRWTAPEVFSTNEYGIKADVWAFGVTLMEIITRGERPYDHMTNEETLKAVQSGYRMPQPTNCPRGLYEVMEKCWCTEGEKRPRFEAIEWQLEEFFVSQCFEDRTYVAPFQVRH